MRDGLLRRWMKRLARGVQVVDLGLTRAAAGRPLFRLEGACGACGACCVEPVVQLPAVLFHLRSWRWLLVRWHRHVNGFALVRADRRTRSLVFRCAHFDPDSRRCDSYASRPLMCRDYPRPVLFHLPPGFLPSCGHRAVPRNAAGLDRALAAQGLPPGKLAELRRRLGLR